MEKEIERLARILADAERVVFFGGAGLSTESGIPDFRSADGVFKATREFGYPPETLLSHTFYMRHPAIFFKYYKQYLLYPGAEPNAAHKSLAKLEWGSSFGSRSDPDAKPKGKLTAVLTQNIDGLHQQAGSRNVLELHGSVRRNRCESCGAFYSLDALLEKIAQSEDGVPRCGCGGRIKPEVVLYEEGLDPEVLGASVDAAASADVMIVGGTSLNVWPAAGLCDYFNGRELVVINLSETARDPGATLTIRRPIGKVLSETMTLLSDKDIDRV